MSLSRVAAPARPLSSTEPRDELDNCLSGSNDEVDSSRKLRNDEVRDLLVPSDLAGPKSRGRVERAPAVASPVTPAAATRPAPPGSLISREPDASTGSSRMALSEFLGENGRSWVTTS